MPPTLYRPEPIRRHRARSIGATTTPAEAAARLLSDETLILKGEYHLGERVLSQLRANLRPPPDDAGYPAHRAFRLAFRQSARRLLAPIVRHRVALRGAPQIGFLRELYPDVSTFSLPFSDIQELSHAWRVYEEGVHLAVLGYRLHPFYGTYVPSRTLHLELFGTWLSRYSGSRGRAIDVGTGCGVLALMLCKAGFARVLATDCSPNAVESVRRQIQRRRASLELSCGDLLTGHRAPAEPADLADLIVFNPPWTPGDVDSLLDRSLYYDDDLFERFFSQAAERLAPDGRIALVFSNLITLVRPDVPHPIEAELTRGRFRLVEKMNRKVKLKGRGRRRSTRERVQVWELAGA